MKLDLWDFVLFLAVLQQTCSGLEVTVPGSSQNASLGTHVVLPCAFSVKDSPVNPNFLAVVWKFGERELVKFDNKGTISNLKASIDVKAAMNGDVSLSLRDVAISDEGTYKCIVIYSPEMEQKTIDLRVRASPSVNLSRKYFQKDQKNTVLCSVRDFYPNAITLTWLWNGRVVLTSDVGKPRGNADGTYNVNSTLVITPTKNQENQLIECQVAHESLGKPTKDGYKVIFGEAPTVQVHSLEIPGRREKVVMCEAKSFYPEVITVNWKLNGQPAETSGRNADGTFSKRFYYHVQPSPDNEAEDISCEVRHETLFSPVTETGSVAYFSDQDKSCHLGLAVMLGVLITAFGIGGLLWFFIYKKKYFRHFIVSPIYELDNDDDEKVTFCCTALNCPEETQVMWCVKDADGETVIKSDQSIEDEEERLILSGYITRTRKSEDDGQHQVITALYFTPSVSKHRSTEIVCRFICDGRTKGNVKKWSTTLRKPQVSDKNPIALSLGDSNDVLCSINLKNFSPKDIDIGWSCGVGHCEDVNTFKKDIQANSQQTFDAESKCRIPKHLFNEPGFKVRVTWTHKSIDQPEWREVSAADIPWCPTMSGIFVPSLLHGQEAKLQCTISEYFPDELTVSWFRTEAGKTDLFPVSSSEKYKIPEKEVTQQEKDRTYTCTASLIVNVSGKTEHGAKFICRVGHPSLNRPLDKETEELKVIGFPTVDVYLHAIKSDHSFVAAVRGFCPKTIEVKWSRKKKGNYKEYQEPGVVHELKENKDGTFDLISKCKIKKMKPKKQYKVSVKHDTLESPVEKILSLSEDQKGWFIVNEEGKNIYEKPPWREDNPPAHPADNKTSNI